MVRAECERDGNYLGVMGVIGRIRLWVAGLSSRKAVRDRRVRGARRVPAVGRTVVGMIVLACLQDALALVRVSPVPVNGVLRALHRERRHRQHRQQRSQPDGMEARQLSVLVNMEAVCSWPWRMA